MCVKKKNPQVLPENHNFLEFLKNSIGCTGSLKKKLCGKLIPKTMVKVSVNPLGQSRHVSAMANLRVPILRCIFRKSGARKENETFKQHL